MKIEYAATIPENVARIAQGKSEILHVGLRTVERQVQRDTLGKVVRDANGAPILVDVEVVHEVPVRKSHYEALTAAKKLAYVCECEKWHHQRDTTVRAKWDDDDKAKADAAAATAKVAEETVFDMKSQGFVKNDKGQTVGVNVVIKWRGFTCTTTIPADPANAETNGKVAWKAAKDAADTEAASLAMFNLTK